ncbi:MAG TPA: hypothetical protein VK516_00655 [Gemmatimonadaceae bacterium]|nr:hypothetical protein [Gemmatimonadaceae bacterium]
MHTPRWVAVAVLLSLGVGCERDADPPAVRAAEPGPGTSSTLTGLPNSIPNATAEDGQWVRPAKDYASTRYSGLSEINTGNVANLKVAWTFSTGVLRGQEAAPIVAGSTMYVVTPYPNILYALDLTKPGETKWAYRPRPAAAAQGVACCDVVTAARCSTTDASSTTRWITIR